jgi:hypothetical protein
MGKNVKKWAAFYDCFHEEESSFGLTDPKLAKKRRDILLPLFSRRAILKLENVIQFSVSLHDSNPLSSPDSGSRSTDLFLLSLCMRKEVMEWPTFTLPSTQQR